ncbi:hypothetical protein Q5752_005049 [Cryptotrichosporon argae]
MPPKPAGAQALGLSFKETVEALSSFLEVALHTILYLRQIYPPTTFARRRSHGVPVYQSRHPDVRAYVADVVHAIAREMGRGAVRRVTVVVKDTQGLPLERFIFDLEYMGLAAVEGRRDVKIAGAPTEDELGLMLRGFLIRLTALDSQLTDNPPDTTFAVVLETKDDVEPEGDADGFSPWAPAHPGDTLNPTPASAPGGQHAPLLPVRTVETGVIDIRLMVQECAAKTGVESLDI